MATTTQKRDYYELLGVDRQATRDQIKQSYRQLALQYHPDRNPSPEATAKFREIAEAYAVLSDEAKRKAYDTTGHAGISERWSTEDLMRDFHFGDFFGGRAGDLFGLFGDLFGPRMQTGRAAQRGADLRYDLELSLEEAARGGERVIEMTRSDTCGICKGSGAKPGTSPTTCQDCGGSGQKQEIKSGKGVRMVTLLSCPRCKGRGQWIESPCGACQGRGIQFLPHTLKVNIPVGVDDGMVIRLGGQGEAGPAGTPPGDFLIRTHIMPHPYLQRQGDDLYMARSVSFPDAALGGKVPVTALGGETVQVTVPAGTQHGTAFRLKGKGMPRLKGKGRGDLYVIVGVHTPTELSPREKELLEELRKYDRRPTHDRT
jgi:molecular chaperone DnaJ